jgi:hypothetical protein
MIAPMVHLNGTGIDELIRQVRTAVEAIDTAIEACKQAAPHARDYYLISDSAVLQATCEHLARLRKLEEVHNELSVIWRAIFDQRRR